jgi:exonuclease III
MKILSWNCRGLSRPTAIQTLRRLIRDQSPDILFLTETKSSLPQVSATLNRLGFFLMSQVAPIGSSGGLVLSWRPGIDLECFVTKKNNISAWCFSTLPILLGFCPASMALLTEEIEWPFGTLLKVLALFLKLLGCV